MQAYRPVGRSGVFVGIFHGGICHTVLEFKRHPCGVLLLLSFIHLKDIICQGFPEIFSQQ